MPVGSEPDNTREGVMVMDMGLHAIPTLVEPQQIIQVLIPGVEERARHLPPLMSSSRLMPGEYLAPLLPWYGPLANKVTAAQPWAPSFSVSKPQEGDSLCCQ